MSDPLSRRDWLVSAGLAALAAKDADAGSIFDDQVIRGAGGEIVIGGRPVEITVASISPQTLRLRVQPLTDGKPTPIAATGELVDANAGRVSAQSRSARSIVKLQAGDLVARFTENPPTFQVETSQGTIVQKLLFDAKGTGVSFLLGKGPLLGLGEGGPQFDRKGQIDPMIIGQGGYHLSTHGTRAPIQWLVGTDGWAMFIHQPYGSFDFTGEMARFTPKRDQGLPFDIFIVSSNDPKTVMREYARITGLPEMPPRWTFGYQQSHRTLDGPGEIMGVAKTLREKNCLATRSFIWAPSSVRRGGTRATGSSRGRLRTSPSRRR